MILLSRTCFDDNDELFGSRYGRLLKWALRLTRNDREQAQDLVQDAVTHVLGRRQELGAVENVDGYLYTSLRNCHLTNVRRAARRRATVLSLSDDEVFSLGAAVAQPRGVDGVDADPLRERVQQRLREIRRYADTRKGVSKAASVLLLRFFHGYYPEEIAGVLRVSRATVDQLMRLARRELRSFLAEARPASTVSAIESRVPDVRLCWTEEAIEHYYGDATTISVPCARVAHLVSCAACLDRINQHLALPTLAARQPFERLGYSRGVGPSTVRPSTRRRRHVVAGIVAAVVLAVSGSLLVRPSAAELLGQFLLRIVEAVLPRRERSSGLERPPDHGAARRGDVLLPDLSRASGVPSAARIAPATTGVELGVLSALRAIDADLGAEVRVRRANGHLVVAGVIESARRRREIVAALAPIARTAAVQVRVASPPVMSRYRPTHPAPAADAAAPSRLLGATQIPAHDSLRAALMRDGMTEADAHGAVPPLAGRVVRRVARLRLRTWALDDLVHRFTPAQIAALDDANRETWQALIAAHARALQPDVDAINRELSPLLDERVAPPPSTLTDGEPPALAAVVQALVDAGNAFDAAVQSGFVLTTTAGDVSPIDAGVAASRWQRTARAHATLIDTLARLGSRP